MESADSFAQEVAALQASAARLPGFLDDAIAGTATFAHGLAGLVQDLDARRAELNAAASSLGADPVPDVVTGCVEASDTVRVRLIAAARRSAAHAAESLGKAARRPACAPQDSARVQPYSGPGDAARAASALLAWTHHQVDDVEAHDLLGDADPVQVSRLLANIVLNLAADVMPGQVDAWLTQVGAEWAVDGD